MELIKTILQVIFVFILLISIKYHEDLLHFFQNETEKFSTNTKQERNITKDKIDWTSYLKNLEIKLSKNWKPPKSNSSKSIVVAFDINRKGYASNIKIKQSSGIKELDDSTIKAILKSMPFEKLPQAYKKEKVPIEFTFDYRTKYSR